MVLPIVWGTEHRTVMLGLHGLATPLRVWRVTVVALSFKDMNMSAVADILACNRALLVHFDSYSAALYFGKWGPTLLAPAALPESATPMAAPADVGPEHGVGAVMDAVVTQLGLVAEEVEALDDFHHWFQTDVGPVRVHLLKFKTFEPPKALLEKGGGVFKAISELRGSPREELGLAREVFNLIIGAGGGRA
jgi:hypothetical protein